MKGPIKTGKVEYFIRIENNLLIMNEKRFVVILGYFYSY